MSNYINTIYDKKKRPINNYPELLVQHLCTRFELQPGMKFLEVGCGRCDHLKLFKAFGLNAFGLDFSKEAGELNPDLQIQVCNLEKDKIPHADSTFDVIYTKSFIEHLFDPTNFLNESLRVLKPNGLIITMVPDWEANMQVYFDDFSHRSPYTVYSLRDLYEMHGFKNIDVQIFRQLPIVWKFPILNYFCAFIAFFTPHRSRFKFLRWSKELMIIGSARKTL